SCHTISAENAVKNAGRLVVDHTAFAYYCWEGGGGAISSTGSLAVKNSAFTKNSAAGGGAIYATGDVFIDNCEFSGNSTLGGGTAGGALALRGGPAVVKNST